MFVLKINLNKDKKADFQSLLEAEGYKKFFCKRGCINNKC